MNEIDLYSFNGSQTDDINSLVEYVNQEILNNPDDTPEDEDNDRARDYGFIQIDYYFTGDCDTISNLLAIFTKISFPEYSVNPIFPVSCEIIAPPPKA